MDRLLAQTLEVILRDAYSISKPDAIFHRVRCLEPGTFPVPLSKVGFESRKLRKKISSLSVVHRNSAASSPRFAPLGLRRITPNLMQNHLDLPRIALHPQSKQEWHHLYPKA